MSVRSKLQELTIKDNFMFGAAMIDPEICRGVLELALGVPIERVEVDKERCIVFHPEFKGVRLDAYAKDKENTRYNVEMQVQRKSAVGKRTRYYHSQMDMEVLPTGEEYYELPNCYVIFICDFDPFGEKKYRYTFENLCLEDKTLKLNDGSRSIFLSTRGENEDEVPKELVAFLKYVRAGYQESTEEYEDTFVRKLQKTVQQIKESREMERHYLIFEEMKRDERMAGKIEDRRESILELLEELGDVPGELRTKIASTSELETLRKWHRLAAKAESVEQFMEQIK